MLSVIRKKAGYSQSSLAIMLGVSQQTISHWENGERQISNENLIKLADLFNCTIDELIRGN